MRPAARLFVLVGLIALAPSVAQAHLNATGMGPLYDGVVHFGLSFQDSLPVAALGLLAGLRGPAAGRWGLAALPAAWLAGGALAMTGLGLPAIILSAATAIIFLTIGGLIAANLALPPRAVVALAAFVGLVRGFADMAGLAFSLPHLGALVGMTACVFAVFAVAASVTLPLTRLWAIVAVRAGGSWLAAIGLLLAGWIWRYGAKAF